MKSIEQKLYECCIEFKRHYSLLRFLQSSDNDKMREVYTKIYEQSFKKLELIIEEAQKAGYKSENEKKREKNENEKFTRPRDFNVYDIEDFEKTVNIVCSVAEDINTTVFPFLIAPNITGVFVYNKSVLGNTPSAELFEEAINDLQDIGILYEYYCTGRDKVLFFLAPTKLVPFKKINNNIIPIKCASDFTEDDLEDNLNGERCQECGSFAGLWEGELVKCAHSIWLDDIQDMCNNVFDFDIKTYFFDKITEKKDFLPCLINMDPELDKYIEEKLKE